LGHQNNLNSPDRAVILVVEDDGCVRSLLSKALRRKLFEVIEAENGDAALEMSRTFRGEIRLLLTDIDMPGMNGVALSETILTERNGIRVLQMSGGCSLAARQSGPAIPFLQKPFQINELFSKIDEVISAPATNFHS
jgi:two-component system, cell cycle sensor histidine kinase and response regulator CckA